jgi:hypothetical protein
MIPIMLLVVLMHMQAQQQRTVFTPDDVKVGDCLKVTGPDGIAVKIPCPEPPPTEPFDVAPVYEPLTGTVNPWDYHEDDHECFDSEGFIHTQRLTCADKSRVLLKTEDGKGHCLALVRP